MADDHFGATAPTTDAEGDALARQLADCPRCLGAHLLATETGRDVTCPGCQAVWRDRPARERTVDVPADLAALARWLPTICGRALAPGGAEGGAGSPRLGARPDAVDAHHRDRRSGLRTALAALTRLDQLERLGRRRQVKVLWWAYVLSGPELALQARHQKRGGLGGLVAERFAPAEMRKHWDEHKSQHVGTRQRADWGERALAGARASYELLVRRALTAPRREGDDARLDGDLAALARRTLDP